MNRLGLELLSVFGMPPVQYVNLAADLGCAYISTGLQQLPFNPYNYPAWSLQDEPALRREMKTALRDSGVSICLGEGFSIRPEREVRTLAPNLDMLAELGAPRVNAVSMDRDWARTLDEVAVLAEMAAQREMDVTIEFAPPNTINNLAAALRVIEHAGNPNVRLLIDTMHFFRSGATVADIAAIDPDLIGHIQLCDATIAPQNPDYLQEAMFRRMAPGEGEFPLRDLLAVLPKHIAVGLETPMLDRAEAGEDPHDYLGCTVTLARAMLESVE